MSKRKKTEAAEGAVAVKAKSDVYSIMLILSFIFILVACLLLWLEMKAYDYKIKADLSAPKSAAAAEAPSWLAAAIAPAGLAMA